MNIKEILTQYTSEVNSVLKEIMNIEKNALAPGLVKAMKYSLFSGGKRLRPILTLMVAEMLDGDRDSALRVGASIELVHTYSLIHDDLPSMDDDDFRRGKPSNHKVFGTATAILAGDALLTFAFNILSKLNLPPDKVLKIIEVISQGAGHNGMVGGQVLDLEAEDKEISLEELKKIHSGKTGALFKSSILAGAYCANPDRTELTALERYARYLGLTFQIVDDILDVTGNEEVLGKRVGRDDELNKATYPRLLGLKQAVKEAEFNAEKARDSLGPFGERAFLLKQLVDYILVRQS
ncbi:polyprenyl synthetase family protein [Halothermothrix orenii]|uniref:polyprenyl synthetase family protein n=1 Tax=Halothermothrix orenii TaxID=31909 RepID=UPI001D0567C6|nr:farnesyl diphosphate synthase [Halothermothrix orenii]